MGRKPIGKTAMTAAERQRRRRAGMAKPAPAYRDSEPVTKSTADDTAALRAELAAASARIAELGATVVQLRAELAKRKPAAPQAAPPNDTATALREESARLQAELATASTRIHNLIAEVARSGTRIRNLEAELAAVRTMPPPNSSTSDLLDHIKQLVSAGIGKDREIARLKRHIAELEGNPVRRPKETMLRPKELYAKLRALDRKTVKRGATEHEAAAAAAKATELRAKYRTTALGEKRAATKAHIEEVGKRWREAEAAEKQWRKAEEG
jgi:predicted RNase H-like nuclease (RuvC/YqgF family)